MTELRGALALVTGASSGIGRASALALAAHGCRLLACGRDEQRLADVAGRTGGEWFAADLTDAAQTAALSDTVAGHGVPDVVVHCAGIGLAGPVEQTDEESLRPVLAVNLLAPMRLTKALLPAMRSRGSGHLVFVGSIAGRLGAPQEACYAASKAAVHAYADSLRIELDPVGIGVTTVVPGVVATDFFDRRGRPYERRFPRPVPPERLADALVRAVLRDRAEVVVPRWLRVPMLVRAAAPQGYAAGAARWA